VVGRLLVQIRRVVAFGVNVTSTRFVQGNRSTCSHTLYTTFPGDGRGGPMNRCRDVADGGVCGTVGDFLPLLLLLLRRPSNDGGLEEEGDTWRSSEAAALPLSMLTLPS
jgi:hypothetical protein